jgi:hypothetical protein
VDHSSKKQAPPDTKNQLFSGKKVKVKHETNQQCWALRNDGAATAAAKKARVLKKLDKAERLAVRWCNPCGGTQKRTTQLGCQWAHGRFAP